jgi:hypothetical protein
MRHTARTHLAALEEEVPDALPQPQSGRLGRHSLFIVVVVVVVVRGRVWRRGLDDPEYDVTGTYTTTRMLQLTDGWRGRTGRPTH